MSARAERAAAWSVVIPLKPNSVAKSRLAGFGAEVERSDPEGLSVRQRLALAMALDTVAATLECAAVRRVLVVTSDEVVADAVRGLSDASGGAELVIVADTAGQLNAAIELGDRRLDIAEPRAALLGDLPALRSGDLTEALAAAAEGASAGYQRAAVPDAEGTGTTLITAAAGEPLVPRFGPGSSAAHADAGHLMLALAAESTLRRDVDTVADLDRAIRLGVGANTCGALADVARSGQSSAA